MNKLHLRIGSAALAFALLLSAVPSSSRPQLPNATPSEIVLAVDLAQSDNPFHVNDRLDSLGMTLSPVKSEC
jgi:hypothetical protein